MSSLSFSPPSETAVQELERALLDLCRIAPVDADAALCAALEMGARALRADTASLWMLGDDGARLVRWHCSLPGHGHGGSGAELAADEVWQRVATLRECRVAEAPRSPGGEAARPRSALDAAVWRGGEVAGFVRVERAGAGEWTAEERWFAASLADRAALELERHANRRATEEALRDSEARFRSMFEQFPASAMRYAPDGRVLEVNRAYTDFWGLGIEDLEGWDLLDDPQLEHVREELRRGFAGETVYLPALEYDARVFGPHVCCDTQWPRWVAAFMFPVRDGSGNVTDVFMVHQDVTDQRAAEAALRASEESYRTIFDSSNDAIFVHDVETGAVLDANRRACEFSSVTLDELRADGLSIIANGPPPFTPERAAAYLRRAAMGQPQRFEWMSRHGRTGEEMWVEVSLQRVSILGEDRLLATVRDIRERKAAENALRASEESYRTIFEHSNDAIFITDPGTGQVIDANRMACEMCSTTLEELRADAASVIWNGPPPYTAEVAREQSRRAAAGEAQRFEWLSIHPRTGEEIWGEVSLQRVTIRGQDRVLALVRDIRERKLAERKLRESEASYRTIFQHSSDPIWVHDLETGAFLDVNEAACEMYGYTAEETLALGVAGLSWGEPPYTVEDARKYIERAAAGEPQRFEWLGRRRDGSPVWGEVRLRRVAINGVDRLLATARDINDRKRAEEVLRRANEELELRVAERTAELAATNEALEEEVAEHEAAKQALLERTREMEGIFQALPDLYFRLGADGTILDYRAGNAEWLAMPPEEFMWRRMQEVLPPPLGGRLAAALAEVTGTGQLVSLEYVLPIAGEPRDFEARILPLGDGTVINVVRDITVRKNAERALRGREAHFRRLIENASDIITILDADGTIRYESPAVERILGYTPEEMTGRSIFEYIHPTDHLGVESGLRQVLDEPGITRPGEYRVRDKGGRWRRMEASARLLRPEAPEAGIVVNTRDVTERKEAEEALRESEARYRTLIEQLPAIIYVASLEEGNPTLFTSPQTEQLLGYSDVEWTSNPRLWLERIHPEDRHRVEEEWSAAHAEGRRFAAEYRMLARDGHVVWVRDEAVLMRGESGEPLCIQGVMLDVTERKRTEQLLRRSDERFRLVVENSSDLVTLLDREGTIWYESPAVERLLGYTPDEMVGRNLFDLIHPEDRATVRARFAEGSLAAAGSQTVTFRFRHADGSWRVMESTGSTLLPDSVAEGVVVNSRDVTERKQAEEALARAKEEAERANRAKSEFLSRMSHELRTPMNSILGFAQVLDMAGLPPEHWRPVQHILKAGRHLLQLINEVLEIARIESGRQTLSLEPVRIGSVLQEAVGLVRPLAGQWGIRLEEEPGGYAGVFVQADRQRLTQVLLNLLSNAIKYNRPGGRVRLTCSPSRGADDGAHRLSVRVEDTGAGIPADKVDQLFTPFARLGAEQTEVEGTGLGLALSQRLTEAMGGTLVLERTGPGGSIFRLDLQAADDPLERVEETPAPPAAGAGGPHGPATLLYIEDNLANLSLVETVLLARPGWRTIPALQGQLGVELAREHRPDLILLDLHLPDIPGEEVLRRLRADERTARVPVVVISADATHAMVDRLAAAGADAYLTKPLDIQEFFATVERFLPDGAPGR